MAHVKHLSCPGGGRLRCWAGTRSGCWSLDAGGGEDCGATASSVFFATDMSVLPMLDIFPEREADAALVLSEREADAARVFSFIVLRSMPLEKRPRKDVPPVPSVPGPSCAFFGGDLSSCTRTAAGSDVQKQTEPNHSQTSLTHLKYRASSASTKSPRRTVPEIFRAAEAHSASTSASCGRRRRESLPQRRSLLQRRVSSCSDL